MPASAPLDHPASSRDPDLAKTTSGRPIAAKH